jgi:integrase
MPERRNLTGRYAAAIQPPAEKRDIIIFDKTDRRFAIRVYQTGYKVWIVQYRSPIDQKDRRLALGTWPTMQADEARASARTLLNRVDSGECPYSEQVAKRGAHSAAKNGRLSVTAVIDKYVAGHINLELKAGRSRTEREAALRSALAPFETIAIGMLDKHGLQARIREIAETRGPSAARHAHSHVHAFLAWAVSHGFAEQNVLSGAKGLSPPKSRDRVLSDEELANIWKNVHGICGDDYRDIVRLLILTGARRSEIAGLRKVDVNLATTNRTISITAEASKSGMSRVIPLGPMASAILAARPKLAGSFVFGTKTCGERPFSGWSKAKVQLDAAVKISPWVVHDIRRSVATRLDELGVSIPVIEDLLGHVSGARGGIVGVYNKADRAARVRDAVERLDAHIAERLSANEAADNVVQLSAGARF